VIVKSGRPEKDDDDVIEKEAPIASNEVVKEENKVVGEAVVEYKLLEAPASAEDESKIEKLNSQQAIGN